MGLPARTVRVEKAVVVSVDGGGRAVDEMVVGAGPGWTSPNSPGSKMMVEQKPSVDVIINMFPSEDLLLV